MAEYDVQIGKVAGAHGLRGEVRVIPFSDIPERCHSLKRIRVQLGTSSELRQVVGAREIPQGLWLLRLEGIDDRTAAEALRGALLFVRAGDSPPLPENVYYQHDIIGLHVLTTEGRELGPITDIIETGANDVYVTAEALIPAISQVVKVIDLTAGTMLIEVIPGLLPED